MGFHHEKLAARERQFNAERRDLAVPALNVLIVLSNPKRNNPALLAFPVLDVDNDGARLFARRIRSKALAG